MEVPRRAMRCGGDGGAVTVSESVLNRQPSCPAAEFLGGVARRVEPHCHLRRSRHDRLDGPLGFDRVLAGPRAQARFGQSGPVKSPNPHGFEGSSWWNAPPGGLPPGVDTRMRTRHAAVDSARHQPVRPDPALRQRGANGAALQQKVAGSARSTVALDPRRHGSTRPLWRSWVAGRTKGGGCP